MKYEFKRPYKFEDAEFTELEVPVEDMTGAQFLAVKKAFVKANPGANPVSMVFDQEFCIYLMARLCRQPIEFFEGMPVNEIVPLCTQVSGFLLS